jgi:hypothetical protein
MFRLENLKGRGHLENLGVDGRIILQWILGKRDGKVWTGFGSGYGPVAGSCEDVNEPSGYKKGVEFLKYLMTINFSSILLHGVRYIDGSEMSPRDPRFAHLLCSR